jgi:hypothetical protein
LARFYFSKNFILTGHPTNGVIHIAADDFAEVYVNGTSAGMIGSTTDVALASIAQTSLQTFDLTSLLKPGRNTITVKAQNGQKAFSFLCGATCTYGQHPAAVVFGGSLSFTK